MVFGPYALDHRSGYFNATPGVKPALPRNERHCTASAGGLTIRVHGHLVSAQQLVAVTGVLRDDVRAAGDHQRRIRENYSRDLSGGH